MSRICIHHFINNINTIIIFIDLFIKYKTNKKGIHYSGGVISLAAWKAEIKAVNWIFSLAPVHSRCSISAILSNRLIKSWNGNSTESKTIKENK